MTHSAVILAAGGSRRLGRPKQLLRREGETLVARVARLVGATGAQRIVVVTGAFDGEVRAVVPGLETVHNADWASGMASSLRVAAAVLADDHQAVLVTVVDQPALDQTHLDALVRRHDGTNDTVSGYGKVLGVPAMLRAATFARVSGLRDDEGFRMLWRDASPDVVRDDRLALDLDTEDDVAAAVAAGWLDPSLR